MDLGGWESCPTIPPGNRTHDLSIASRACSPLRHHGTKFPTLLSVLNNPGHENKTVHLCTEWFWIPPCPSRYHATLIPIHPLCSSRCDSSTTLDVTICSATHNLAITCLSLDKWWASLQGMCRLIIQRSWVTGKVASFIVCRDSMLRHCNVITMRQKKQKTDKICFYSSAWHQPETFYTWGKILNYQVYWLYF